MLQDKDIHNNIIIDQAHELRVSSSTMQPTPQPDCNATATTLKGTMEERNGIHTAKPAQPINGM